MNQMNRPGRPTAYEENKPGTIVPGDALQEPGHFIRSERE